MAADNTAAACLLDSEAFTSCMLLCLWHACACIAECLSLWTILNCVFMGVPELVAFTQMEGTPSRLCTQKAFGWP